MPDENTTPTTARFSFMTVMTLLSLIAQALIYFAVFDTASTAGKLVGVVGMVATGFGGPLKQFGAKAATSAGMVLLLALALAPSQTGCKAPVGPVVDKIIDCTAESQSDLVRVIEQMGPLLKGDEPNWTKAKSDALAAGEKIGGCALAWVIQQYMAPPAGTALPPPEQAIKAKETLETFRKEHAGGATFHTKAGDL